MAYLRNIIQLAAGLALATLISGCALMDAFDEPTPEVDRQELFGKAAGPQIPDLPAKKHEEMGDMHMSRGQHATALAHYQRAAAKDPENLGAALKHGYALLETDQVEQSLTVFNTVLDKQPEAAMAHAGAGMAYFRSGLSRQAEARLRRAVALDDSLWRAHNVLGIIHTRNHDPAAALDALQQARDLAPGHPQVLNNLGVAHMMAGDYQAAAKTLRQAARAGAVGEKTSNNLGVSLARLGRFDEALEAFMAAGDEARAYNNLGCALMLMDRHARAVAAFEKAMEAAPRFYVKAHENMRRARMAAGFQGGVVPRAPEAPASTPAAPRLPAEPARGQGPVKLQEHSRLQPLPGAQVVPASAVRETALRAEPRTLRRESRTLRRVQPIRPAPETSDGAPNHRAESANWGVHVSSWRTLDKASRRARDLESEGLRTSVSAVDLGERGVWYRVLAGRYPNRDAAIAKRPDVLEKLDMDKAFVFRIR
jgi:Flp pilus assembly protein TadD